MKIANIHKFFLDSSGVTIDSRNTPKNSLFIALKGENFDGNDYAESAINNGCDFAIVDKTCKIKNPNFIVVEDTLKTLQELASYHRKYLGIPILALTGTNGKTTTKELISTVLNKKFTIGYTKGNFNNHIGVPLTLLSFSKDIEMGIIEMGANHPGEIKELCQIAQPNYGLITNVGKAHLEGFGSFEGVKQTKKELYDYLIENKGKIFINSDNEHLVEMLGNYPSISYSKFNKSFCNADIASADPYLVLKLSSIKGFLYIKSKLVGSYNFENILAACCIGRFFQVNEIKIQKAIEFYNPENNRSQLKKTEQNTLILDYYNANPTSMKLSIENFSKMSSANKMLILGDMLELGSDSDKEHQNIVKLVRELDFKNSIFIGKEFEKNKSNDFLFFNNVEELNQYLSENSYEDFKILIKGSRGIKLEKCVENF